jgi:hypothetical protein
MGIRRKYPTVPRRIYLTPELAGKVDLYLTDPSGKKPKYAALSVLCEALLKEYFDRLTAEAASSNKGVPKSEQS